MTTMTYYVVLAFKRSEDDGGEIVACDPLRSYRVLTDRRPGSWRLRGCGDPEDNRRGGYRATIDLKENSYGSIK
jgi:hypothetical protein